MFFSLSGDDTDNDPDYKEDASTSSSEEVSSTDNISQEFEEGDVHQAEEGAADTGAVSKHIKEPVEHVAEAAEQNEQGVQCSAKAPQEEYSYTTECVQITEKESNNEAAEKTLANNASSSEEDGSSRSDTLIKIQARRNKKNVCPYCQEPQTMFARHVFRKHASEAEVCEALSYPTKSEERRNVLAGLVHRGNYMHNAEVLKTGRGTIIPGRCAAKSLDAKQEYFLPCSKCKGFFSRKNLYRHSCNASDQGRRFQTESKRILPTQDGVSEGLKEVLDAMRDDEVGILVQNDKLILEFGSRLFTKHGKHKHLHAHIREKMRELGRLLLHLRKKDAQVSLESLIHPSKFMEVVEAVSEMTKDQNGVCNNPSLALKLGYSLHDVAEVVKTRAIVEGKDGRRAEADDFVQLYKREWKVHVSSHALEKLHERKWNKEEALPRNEDVRKVTEILNNDMAEAQQELEHEPSKAAYSKLAQAALAAIILFNRRRPGETSRLTVQAYVKRSRTVNEEIMEHFSALEKELCSSLGYVEVRGKRGRKVPMLLTAKLQGVLDLLVATRETVGIAEDNPYLFVGASGTTLRGSDCIRRTAEKTGASNVSATKYRKHFATMMQLIQLSDNEMDIVAKFMGHDIRVHKEFYRLPDKTVDVAKVTKLLMATDKGMGAFVGSTLDELDPTTEPAEGTAEEAGAEASREETAGSLTVSTSVSNRQPENVTVKKHVTNHPKPNEKRGNQTKVGTKRSWTQEEKETVKKRFKKCLDSGTVPQMHECLKVLREEPALSRRSWKDIKYCVHNLNVKQKRESAPDEEEKRTSAPV